MPGLKFFKKLNEAGNFVPIIAVPGTVASGETPITMRWDYLALSNRDKSAGNPNIGVIIPASGMVAGVYVQGISAYAPTPTRPGCGRSTSTPTKASSSGSRATATRSGSTTWPSAR